MFKKISMTSATFHKLIHAMCHELTLATCHDMAGLCVNFFFFSLLPSLLSLSLSSSFPDAHPSLSPRSLGWQSLTSEICSNSDHSDLNHYHWSTTHHAGNDAVFSIRQNSSPHTVNCYWKPMMDKQFDRLRPKLWSLSSIPNLLNPLVTPVFLNLSSFR